MLKLSKNTKTLLLSFFMVLGVSLVGGAKASAATLTVSDGCTLPEAITSINNAANETGCSATGSYGTDDTINLSSGTITLNADLPVITKSIKVIGSGSDKTTVDANDNDGFVSQLDGDDYDAKVTIQGLEVTGAKTYAIKLSDFLEVNLEDLNINDSGFGVFISGTTLVVKDVEALNNKGIISDDEGDSGLSAQLSGKDRNAETSLTVTDSKFNSNGNKQANQSSGLILSTTDDATNDSGQKVKSHSITIKRTTINGNTSERGAGLFLSNISGPLSTVDCDLEVNAVTIANNIVAVKTADPVTPGSPHVPVTSGFYLAGKLTERQNFINVTVANNKVTNIDTDNRNTIAGFFGAISFDGAPLSIVNTTVVGNIALQPDELIAFPAFSVIRLTLNTETYAVEELGTGSSATNTLVANNKRNNSSLSCSESINLSALGLSGTVNTTPDDQGYNMSDDTTCQGFKYEKDLYDTIEHKVANNGGSVPTIKLLENSPAINGGGRVLGISTDARGVARNKGYYSVGAYQGELLAASTQNQLADTGIIAISSIVLGVIILIVLAYTYFDYRRHRKPLVQADPYARQTYTYGHHIKTVTFPLLRYRLNISLSRKPKGVAKF